MAADNRKSMRLLGQESDTLKIQHQIIVVISHDITCTFLNEKKLSRRENFDDGFCTSFVDLNAKTTALIS